MDQAMREKPIPLSGPADGMWMKYELLLDCGITESLKGYQSGEYDDDKGKTHLFSGRIYGF